MCLMRSQRNCKMQEGVCNAIVLPDLFKQPRKILVPLSPLFAYALTRMSYLTRFYAVA
jgi:hypothetical protein